jgi:hypothetical protein
MNNVFYHVPSLITKTMKNIFSMGGQSAVPAQTKTIGNAMNITKMKRIVLFAVSFLTWNVMSAQTEKAVNYFVPTGYTNASYKMVQTETGKVVMTSDWKYHIDSDNGQYIIDKTSDINNTIWRDVESFEISANEVLQKRLWNIYVGEKYYNQIVLKLPAAKSKAAWTLDDGSKCSSEWTTTTYEGKKYKAIKATCLKEYNRKHEEIYLKDIGLWKRTSFNGNKVLSYKILVSLN